MSDEVSLGDVCSQIVDCEHKTAPEAISGHEYGYAVGTPNIRDGRLLLATAKRVDKATYEAWTAREVPLKHDIVLTREAPVGEAAILDGSSPICLGQRTVLLRPNPTRVSPRYLHYRLLSPGIQEKLRSRSEGSTVAHLNVGDIRKLMLGSLPSLLEQERIGTLLGALDDKITVNDQISYTSLSLAQVKYEEIAEADSWPTRPLGEAARWLSGGTPSTMEPTYWGGTIPWISALSLKSPWISNSDRNVTQLGVENGTRVVPKDTIIFVVRGSSLDSEFRIGMAQREVAFGQDCKALIAADDVDPVILFLAVRSRTSDILNLVDHAGHGAGRLATDLIMHLRVAISETSPNSRNYNNLRYLMDVGARRQAENQVLTRMREALLPGLISGTIRLRSAERFVDGVT